MLPEETASIKIWAAVLQKNELSQDKEINTQKAKTRKSFVKKETWKLCIYYKVGFSQTLLIVNQKMCTLSYDNYDMKGWKAYLYMKLFNTDTQVKFTKAKGRFSGQNICLFNRWLNYTSKKRSFFYWWQPCFHQKDFPMYFHLNSFGYWNNSCTGNQPSEDFPKQGKIRIFFKENDY